MNILPVLFITWTALAALFLTLIVYLSRLTRYVDDKLFLDGHDDYGEKVQSEIVRKANRMEPLMKCIGMATGLMSVGIVGVYLYRAILVLQS